MENAVNPKADSKSELKMASVKSEDDKYLKRAGENCENIVSKKQKASDEKTVVCSNFKTNVDKAICGVTEVKNIEVDGVSTENKIDVKLSPVKVNSRDQKTYGNIDQFIQDSADIVTEQNSIGEMEIVSTNVVQKCGDTVSNQNGVEKTETESTQTENYTPFKTTLQIDESYVTSNIEKNFVVTETKSINLIQDCISSDSLKTTAKQRHQIEADVGITEYIGKHKGFRGILKHRYSDFIVNEITKDNIVVELTSFDLPPEGPKIEKDALKNLIPDDKILEIEELAKGDQTEIIIIKADNLDKETRTKIHECIKENYQTLTSATDIVNEERIITIRQLSDQRKQQRKSWPRYRPNFTHFVMYKENTDTLQAINRISNMLRIKPGEFNYAGTKDKRGKTSQMVSVKRVEGERLMQINKGLRTISLGNVCYKDFQLKLGDLAGNRFTIVLREIDGDDVELITALTSFRDKGFINYYGMQRFGTTEISTHSVGRALILQKWQEAINLILMPRAGDGEYINACRRIWSETKNATKAFNALSRKDTIEGQLLKGLMSHKPNDLVNALNNVPRNMRLMYLHSYQSYIWNTVVSKRISQFGLEPKVGDLYQKLEAPIYTVCADNHKVRVVEDVPRIVIQEDIDNKLVTIYDIVLPLPGNNVIYPTNEVAEWYKEILAKDDMDLDSFVSRVRMYSLSGSYRHLILKPKNFSYSVLMYDNKDEELTLSDWDKLMANELKIQESDKYKALKLIFDLDSSTYATMAIREITKRDTSVWAQKTV